MQIFAIFCIRFKSCCWLKSYFSSCLISTTTGIDCYDFCFSCEVSFPLYQSGTGHHIQWEFSEEILICYRDTKFYFKKSKATAQVENGISVHLIRFFHEDMTKESWITLLLFSLFWCDPTAISESKIRKELQFIVSYSSNWILLDDQVPDMSYTAVNCKNVQPFQLKATLLVKIRKCGLQNPRGDSRVNCKQKSWCRGKNTTTK